MLFAGQTQKETTVNEALVAIDFLLAGAVEGVVSVPPTSPSAGMAWIVGAAPTGAFTGKVGQIAGWTEGGWRFVQPSEGMRSFDQEVAAFRQYSGGWTLVSAPDLPVGGAFVDVQARACLTELIEVLEQIGIFSPT